MLSSLIYASAIISFPGRGIYIPSSTSINTSLNCASFTSTLIAFAIFFPAVANSPNLSTIPFDTVLNGNLFISVMLNVDTNFPSFVLSAYLTLCSPTRYFPVLDNSPFP